MDGETMQAIAGFREDGKDIAILRIYMTKTSTSVAGEYSRLRSI